MELSSLSAICTITFTFCFCCLLFIQSFKMRFKQHIKDLSDDGGCIVPSVFLISVKNWKSHLQTKSTPWLANKSFGTGSSCASEQRLPAYSLKSLEPIMYQHRCYPEQHLYQLTPVLAMILTLRSIVALVAAVRRT